MPNKTLGLALTLVLTVAAGISFGHALTTPDTGLVGWGMTAVLFGLAYEAAERATRSFKAQEPAQSRIDQRFQVINFDGPRVHFVTVGQTISALRADAKLNILNGIDAAENQEELFLLDFLDTSLGNVDIRALKDVIERSFDIAWTVPFDEPQIVLAHLGRDETQDPRHRRAANWLSDELRAGSHDVYFLISLGTLLREVLASQEILSNMEAAWSYSN